MRAIAERDSKVTDFVIPLLIPTKRPSKQRLDGLPGSLR
jgi:hypothetical protein